jgi:hypothetical protein
MGGVSTRRCIRSVAEGGRAVQQAWGPGPGKESLSSQFDRVRTAARPTKKERLIALLHHVAIW